MEKIALRERPILFNGEMVRDVLDGRKTQTRRVIKPQPADQLEVDRDEWPGDYCPYGVPSDRLWVRETCHIWGRWRKNGLTKSGKQAWTFKAETPHTVIFDAAHPQVATKTTPRETCMYWKRPSIFMPRWASRILLEITDVRVERVQEISVDDIESEGLVFEYGGIETMRSAEREACLLVGFEELWDSINAKRGFGWDVNPWVWVVEFKTVETNKEASP